MKVTSSAKDSIVRVGNLHARTWQIIVLHSAKVPRQGDELGFERNFSLEDSQSLQKNSQIIHRTKEVWEFCSQTLATTEGKVFRMCTKSLCPENFS